MVKKIMLFSIMFLIVIGNSFGSEKEKVARKYKELAEIFHEIWENKKERYEVQNKTYVAKFVSIDRFSDCNGDFPRGTIRGLFFSLDGERYAIKILEKGDPIVGLVFVKSWVEDEYGQWHKKYYRAHRVLYLRESEEWIIDSVVREVIQVRDGKTNMTAFGVMKEDKYYCKKSGFMSWFE